MRGQLGLDRGLEIKLYEPRVSVGSEGVIGAFGIGILFWWCLRS